MPKRIGQKDKSVFYYAYKLGKLKDKVYYGDIKQAEGQFTAFNGTKKIDYYGEEFEYNATLVLQENVKFIDKFTKIWYGLKPLTVTDTTSYEVTYITQVKDGLYTIYLKSQVTNSNQIWYEYDNVILAIDAYFDFNTKTAIIPKSTYLEIDYSTKVWYEEPLTSEETEAKLKLVYKEETNDSVILTFEEVE